MGSSFNILYLNARSLKNKHDDLESFINSGLRVFHILVITETWLSKDEKVFYEFRNYQSFHSTRDHSRGGGVAIYVYKPFDSANELSQRNSNGNNFVAIELLREKVKILAFYRQPNNKSDPSGSIFVDELNSILSNYRNCYVFGDFNINVFDSNSLVEKYKDTIALNDYVFVTSFSHDFPTRINYDTGTFSSIDHVFTDLIEDDNIHKFSLSYFDLVADHKALCLSVWKHNFSKLNNQPFTYSLINNKNISSKKLLESLRSEDFNELAMDIKKIIDENTVTITRTNKNRKSYVNKQILKFIEIKRDFEILKRKYPLCKYVNEKWKYYRNKVTNLCAKEKKKFLDNFFTNNLHDSKKVWGKLNEVMNKQPKKSVDSIQMLVENGEKLTDKKAIADSLNKFYVNIAQSARSNRKSRQNITNYHKKSNSSIKFPFECSICTEDEVKILISNLNNSNANDVFGMSNNFLKYHSEALTPIITKIINKHLFEGNFPDALKFSLIKPIYKKKGSKAENKSYRPVSLVCILSKIFEGVIHRRIFEHCRLNDFFHPNQFGYQEKSGTEAAMLHTMHDIYSSINKRFLTALLTIDLTSAFDCIDHEILLIKLAKLGLPDFFINLLKSFLIGRSQCVKVDEALSEILTVICGSPQGGVLSGLLFNIYVNSVFELPLSSKIRLYCDDMSLITSGLDREDLKFKLENDLTLIDEWLDYHCLKANYSKTNYVLFCGRKKFENFIQGSLDIKLHDVVIERVDNVKMIGLYVDEMLNFSVHIDQLKRKIIPFVAKLGRIRRFISENTALQLYHAHVMSHIIFMNAIWSVAPKYLTDTLGVIQRRALRIVFMKDRRCHNFELFSEKLLPFEAVCKYQQNLTLFKIRHGLQKNHVSLPLVSDRHNYYTRSLNNYLLESAAFSIYENDFYYRATRSFNELPENVKKYHNLTSFKRSLREFLYDSIDRL